MLNSIPPELFPQLFESPTVTIKEKNYDASWKSFFGTDNVHIKCFFDYVDHNFKKDFFVTWNSKNNDTNITEINEFIKKINQKNPATLCFDFATKNPNYCIIFNGNRFIINEHELGYTALNPIMELVHFIKNAIENTNDEKLSL